MAQGCLAKAGEEVDDGDGPVEVVLYAQFFARVGTCQRLDVEVYAEADVGQARVVVADEGVEVERPRDIPEQLSWPLPENRTRRDDAARQPPLPHATLSTDREWSACQVRLESDWR